MSARTAAIIGSTGMIGSQLLSMALSDPSFEVVRILVRRPTELRHPKLEVKLVDFRDAESIKLALEGVDVIFSCTGTTQSQVKGDQALYRHIDLEIPVNAARFGKQADCKSFVIVTAVGADSKSSNAYLKLKGETEDLLAATGLQTIHVMEPSMLYGKRGQKRRMENILQIVWKPLSYLLVGNLSRLKGIDGEVVARAMLNAGKLDAPGFFRHQYKDIVRLATT